MIKRYVELDILRGIAIVGVILIHITGGLVEDGSMVALFVNQASRYAVPAFLFLSGLNLTISNKLKQGYFTFLQKQISKMISLYFIWNVIYYIATSDSYSILQFIKGFIFGINYYHLYYVPLIISLYLSYPLLLKISKTSLGLIVVLGLTVLSQLADILTGIEIFNNALNVFNWMFYFVLGIWLAHNFETKLWKIKKRNFFILVLFTIALSILFTESYLLIDGIGLGMATTSMRPSNIIFSTSFIYLVLSINWKNNKFKDIIIRLANLSYGIYLSHALILTVFVKIYKESGILWNSILYIIITFLIVILSSIVLTIVINNIIHLIKVFFNNKINEEITE